MQPHITRECEGGKIKKNLHYNPRRDIGKGFEKYPSPMRQNTLIVNVAVYMKATN